MHKPTTATTTVGFGLRAEDHIVMRQLAAQRDLMTQTSCAGWSWLPLPLVSFPPFSLVSTPNRPCQSERSPNARHEADSFEPAEWSERLTPGQSGWLGAAAVGSIPTLALSHSQKVYKKLLLFLQRLFISSRCSFSCHSLLCPAPVCPGCLFRFFLSHLSPSSQPQSTVSVRT